MAIETEVRKTLGLGAGASTAEVVAEVRRLRAVALAVETVSDADYAKLLREAGIESGAARGEEPPRLTVANALANIAMADGPVASEQEFLARLEDAERTTGIRYGDDGSGS